MSLDQACALQFSPEQGWIGEAPEGWGQGRAVYGGLVGAWFARAWEAHSGGLPLRSLHLSLLAPVRPGPFQVQIGEERRGRALHQGNLTLHQDGELKAIALASAGPARVTGLHVPASTWTGPQASEEHTRLPYLPGITPEFTQQFEYRWLDGGVPFSGATEPRYRGYIRPLSVWRADAGLLAALADAWPAPALALLRGPAPVSTATWSLEIVDSVEERDLTGFWHFQCHTECALAGHTWFSGELFAPDGRLMALSRQHQVEFSAP
jgi:acyl-CoA thioesterase